jgi:hypothetical protein
MVHEPDAAVIGCHVRGGGRLPDRLGAALPVAAMRLLRRADTVKTVSWSSDIGWCRVGHAKTDFRYCFLPMPA